MKTLFLLFLVTGLGLIASQDLPKLSLGTLLKGNPNTNDEIPLYTLSTGEYYLNIDIVNKKIITGDPNDIPSTVAMIPVFYTSEILFVNQCLDFSSYNCADYDCTLYKSPISMDFLNFRADCYVARTHAYMDYKNWDLFSYVLIANRCTSDGVKHLGKGAYGILGMGYEVIQNYIGSKVFSIYLDEDGKEGKLLFHWNSDYAGERVITLGTYNNWITPDIKGIGVDGSIMYSYNLALLFDISTDIIGISSSFYSFIRNILRADFGVSCTYNKNDKPICILKDQIKNLPTIYLLTDQDRKEKLAIPPQIYVENVKNDSVIVEKVTLNLRIISSNSNVGYYVMPKYASNYIILGTSFIKHYYLKFDIADQSISIYNKKIGRSSFSKVWIYISIGIIVFIIVLSLSFKCLKRKIKPQKEEEPLRPEQGINRT